MTLPHFVNLFSESENGKKKPMSVSKKYLRNVCFFIIYEITVYPSISFPSLSKAFQME